MMFFAAIEPWQWVVIGVALAVVGAGFGLVLVNLAAIIRPRSPGQETEPRPLAGLPQQMTRRGFFRKVLGAGFGIAMLEGFGLGSLAFLWPDLSGGFGGEITLPTNASEIKATIQSTKQPFYFAPGRFYLVPYDGKDDGLYTDDGLVAGGLMALYQRCVHLGCRVPFCEASQWFECPCHGSKYNKAGEFQSGPAPRGLDRFPLTVDERGVVRVNTGIIVTGPVRGTNTTGQQPEGPFCVDPSAVTAEEHG